jgi:hypothetical protein
MVSRPKGPFAPNSDETKEFLAHNGGEFNGANTVDGCVDHQFIWLDQWFKVGPFKDFEERNDWVRDTFFEGEPDAFQMWLVNDREINL